MHVRGCHSRKVGGRLAFSVRCTGDTHLVGVSSDKAALRKVCTLACDYTFLTEILVSLSAHSEHQSRYGRYLVTGISALSTAIICTDISEKKMEFEVH
jgi:hypothetical protein